MTLSIAFRLSRLAVAATLCTALAVQTVDAQEGQPAPGLTQQHELLKEDVGTWDAAIKIWSDPGAEPTVSQGRETNELLPGGLWLVSRFEGTMGDMPFAGAGTWGYDPIEKKYVGIWVDSMTPHVTTMKGDYDPQTKTITTVTEGRDWATGEMTKFKMITRYLDINTRSFEMYAPGANGEFWKMMEVQYKRRAE